MAPAFDFYYGDLEVFNITTVAETPAAVLYPMFEAKWVYPISRTRYRMGTSLTWTHLVRVALDCSDRITKIFNDAGMSFEPAKSVAGNDSDPDEKDLDGTVLKLTGFPPCISRHALIEAVCQFDESTSLDAFQFSSDGQALLVTVDEGSKLAESAENGENLDTAFGEINVQVAKDAVRTHGSSQDAKTHQESLEHLLGLFGSREKLITEEKILEERGDGRMNGYEKESECETGRQFSDGNREERQKKEKSKTYDNAMSDEENEDTVNDSDHEEAKENEKEKKAEEEKNEESNEKIEDSNDREPEKERDAKIEISGKNPDSAPIPNTNGYEQSPCRQAAETPPVPLQKGEDSGVGAPFQHIATTADLSKAVESRLADSDMPLLSHIVESIAQLPATEAHSLINSPRQLTKTVADLLHKHKSELKISTLLSIAVEKHLAIDQLHLTDRVLDELHKIELMELKELCDSPELLEREILTTVDFLSEPRVATAPASPVAIGSFSDSETSTTYTSTTVENISTAAGIRHESVFAGSGARHGQFPPSPTPTATRQKWADLGDRGEDRSDNRDEIDITQTSDNESEEESRDLETDKSDDSDTCSPIRKKQRQGQANMKDRASGDSQHE